MNDERHRHHGHGVWPFLLVGGSIAMARHMGRRHGMGPRGRHAWTASDTGSERGFRLPPKIEAILDAWHTQAHSTAAPEEPPAA